MRKLILPFFVFFLLASCSNRHKAETVIGAFLDAHLVDTEYETEFVAMDSTNKIRPEVLANMQQQALRDPAFKHDISWTKAADKGYFFLRMRIIQGQDTAVRTFYLDRELTRVVAFKQN